MKIWIIEASDFSFKYLIAKEKSIWITEQPKELNIEKLIADRNLGDIKSYRYDTLKEIIFIESDSTILFKRKDNDDDQDEDEIIEINMNFLEIKTS